MTHEQIANIVKTALEEDEHFTDVMITETMENATEIMFRDEEGSNFTVTVADFE